MDPKNPVMGQFVFDGTEFLDYARDLPPGACQGMLSTREGFKGVYDEVVAVHAEWGGKAGISDQELADLTTTHQRIARIDAFLPALAKAVEILTETRYLLDDKRQRFVLDVAQGVDRRAKNVPELKAKYQKTREYRSEIARKGLKTKGKNAEQDQAPAADGATPGGQPPVSP
jgi:general stress protein YciG